MSSSRSGLGYPSESEVHYCSRSSAFICRSSIHHSSQAVVSADPDQYRESRLLALIDKLKVQNLLLQFINPFENLDTTFYWARQFTSAPLVSKAETIVKACKILPLSRTNDKKLPYQLPLKTQSVCDICGMM